MRKQGHAASCIKNVKDCFCTFSHPLHTRYIKITDKKYWSFDTGWFLCRCWVHDHVYDKYNPVHSGCSILSLLKLIICVRQLKGLTRQNVPSWRVSLPYTQKNKWHQNGSLGEPFGSLFAKGSRFPKWCPRGAVSAPFFFECNLTPLQLMLGCRRTWQPLWPGL